MRINIFILIVFLASCSDNKPTKKHSLVSPNIDLSSSGSIKEETVLVDSLQNDIKPLTTAVLTSTSWIHHVAEGCVDTITFFSNQEGREFSCELLIDNRFTYDVVSDTLHMHEYGLISEVDASKGEEVKNEWTYVLENRGLRMVGSYANQELIFEKQQ